MEKSLKFVWIKDEYIKELKKHSKSENIRFNKKEKRPYIGILFNIKNNLYVAPLGSPKPKHIKLNDKIMSIVKLYSKKDFNYNIKNITPEIEKEFNEKYLGIVNLNNMIPISKNSMLDKNIKDFDKKYQALLSKELKSIKEKKEEILSKAKMIYNKYNRNKLSPKMMDSCNNFKKLEKICLEWENQKIQVISPWRNKIQNDKKNSKDREI